MGETEKSATISEIETMLRDALVGLMYLKSNNKSDSDRQLDICITEAEKLSAYFWYIAQNSDYKYHFFE
jgi:hypothetical protein